MSLDIQSKQRLFEIKEEQRRRKKAEEYRNCFYSFFKVFWDTIVQETPVFNWHIEYLCSVLQDAIMRVIARQPKQYDIIINIPPGTTKSTICTQMLPAWAWAVDPSLRFIAGSYSEKLELESAEHSRDIVLSEKYQYLFPEVSILPDRSAKSNYKTDEGGQRFSTSIRSTATGVHAHCIVIDDPLNPNMASSPTELENANAWISKTMSTRKVDKKITLMILVMQRLSVGDPSGIMLSKSDKKILHICLPADDTYPIKPAYLSKYYKDGLLDPIRLDRKALADQKSDLGSIEYAGQFGQKPTPPEGGLFKSDWWNTYKEIPGDDFAFILQSWDTAFKKNDQAAYTVCITFFYKNHKIYVLNVWRKKVEYPELRQAVLGMYASYSPHEIIVEDKASGQSLVQEMSRDLSLPIKAITPKTGDKFIRAQAVAPTVEAGACYLPESATWLEDFKDEIENFPNSEYDDQVDAFSQGLDHLRGINFNIVFSSQLTSRRSGFGRGTF